MSDRRRDERISVILTLLSRRGELQVRFLPGTLGVSGATVRRDLAVMEGSGLVRRSYGKITAARRGAELPVSLRNTQNTEAKRRIGALASSLIPSRPLVVALSGGSTLGFVAKSLAARSDLTVVTNGLDTATSLMERQLVQVVVTGGTARSLSRDLVGKGAEKSLRSYRFDFAIVGADGVCPEAGVTRHSARGAEIDRIMLGQAERRIVVADSTKLGQVRQAKVVDTGSVHTLVTDSHANAAIVAALRGAGVTTTMVVVPTRPVGGSPWTP
ncbi:DeoR/GlpR family DNA-binding transcription regulator [Streptomyces sp. MW-W600-10]|uniref:DeoR/GlpR family DNA-binding transcription regulator n=1 Tax=Streptomyces sp. MW-W600-10 TaxID=2829819 RepID=UPI001C482FBE|nr:DeoR/GlpR family DNA-binding transcription regulator [Streptomyces sp. MW-W600-10]MBV7242594.1 DeoR/GlpR transcriptional regulator [Streptomyces sp. MW-W600-10]